MIIYSSPGKEAISEGKGRFSKGERKRASCFIMLYVNYTSKNYGSLYRDGEWRKLFSKHLVANGAIY